MEGALLVALNYANNLQVVAGGAGGEIKRSLFSESASQRTGLAEAAYIALWLAAPTQSPPLPPSAFSVVGTP